MDLEFHVPISPTEGFFNRLRYLFRSWQIYGDRGLGYRFVVTVGADQEPEDLLDRVPWARGEPIVWRWFPRHLFRRHSWWGNPANNRRTSVPRHTEIPDGLARKICRDLGIPEP